MGLFPIRQDQFAAAKGGASRYHESLGFEPEMAIFIIINQWIIMSILNSTALDELARRLAESVPESLRAFGRDLEGNFKAVLQAQLSKLDLVSRQEFDVQAALLARTQEKLAALDTRLQELEQKR
jgi:ubiquinone biosynthesis accessory factor UbiK